MRRRHRVVVALLLVAIAGLAAASAEWAARRRAPRGPVLVLRATDGGDPSVADDVKDEDERAMSLAMASVSPAERRRIVELMGYATARLEARLSPLADDLGDEDPVEELRSALRPYLPALTAARSLDRLSFRASGLAVRIAASCELADVSTDETCVALWDPAEGANELARRARFAAWSASSAAVVEVDSKATAAPIAAALREEATRESSTIALVLMDEDLALVPVPERQEMKETARRLGAVMAASELDDARSHLDALARPPPSGRVAPWLAISPSTIVIVPRLSALTRRAAMIKEVEDAARGANVRWIHRPTELR